MYITCSEPWGAYLDSQNLQTKLHVIFKVTFAQGPLELLSKHALQPNYH